MRTIEFSCRCGKRLQARITAPAKAGERAQLRFHAVRFPFERITECSNCQRELSGTTSEEFLETVFVGY